MKDDRGSSKEEGLKGSFLVRARVNWNEELKGAWFGGGIKEIEEFERKRVFVKIFGLVLKYL